jgi:UPF0716 family protein affecting phage T7 exclusion
VYWDQARILRSIVSTLSPDGRWWWSGAEWVPITGVPLALSATEFERSGGLDATRRLINLREWIWGGVCVAAIGVVTIPVGLLLMIAFMVVQYRAFKGYRQWTYEMLAMATAQLGGPDEPMLAGETAVRATSNFFWPGMQRDCAIAATKDHVILYQIDHFDFPLSRVIFAAPCSQVDMVLFKGMLQRSIAVSYAGRQWIVRGIRGVFQGEPVVQAWWKSRYQQVASTAASIP